MNVDSIMNWERLGEIPATALRDTRLQLHWAAQIPAAVGSSWAAPAPNFAHLALEWREDARLCVSELSNTTPRFRAGLRPADLTLVLLDDADVEVDSYALVGRTMDEGLAWLRAAAIAHLRSVPAAPLALPTHALPAHPVGKGEPFTASSSGAGAPALVELTKWFANADRVLRGLKRKVNHASMPRLWPHHFDLAVQIQLDWLKQGEDARSIGVGLSPGDDSYPEPYWYVTPWPHPEGTELRALEGGGEWHTDGWTGAVLRAAVLEDGDDAEAQVGRLLTFLHSAINGAWAVLQAVR